MNETLHVGRPNIGDRQAFMKLAEAMFDRNWLTNNGPYVKELEGRIADYVGVKHCVAMCNGTLALEIAIRALHLSDEVIVPSYTFIATAHALHWQGLTPVFADIDPVTQNLDPQSVESLITPRTTGILAVHLWGRPAPIDTLQALADKHGIELLFDAAHAFGCSHKDNMIGGFGRAEIFSFHATKSFNSFEGGAVVTNDDTLAEEMRLIRNFGFSGFDNVIHPGTNGKMPEICAAMGLVNLDSLPRFIQKNKANYRHYQERIADIPGISLLAYNEARKSNYHYVVLCVESGHTLRDQILQQLHGAKILARKYFWPGCHNMQPYRTLFPDAGQHLPNTEHVANRVLVLPTGTAVEDADIERICRIIRDTVS